MRKLPTLILLAVLSSNVNANFYTGNQYLENCKKNTDFCMIYAAGVIDTLQTIESMTPTNQVCVDNSVTIGQFSKAVVKFMGENPQFLNNMASEIILLAAMEYFPCKKTQAE